MALKRNGREVFYNNPGIYLGSTSLQSGNFIKGGLRNRNAGGLSQIFSAYGNGALSPNAYLLPNKSGSISSYTRSAFVLDDTTANLVPAMPMTATGATALTVLNAQLDQVVQFIASGVMAITGSANLAAAVAAQASATMTLAASALAGGIFPVTASSTMNLSPSVTLTAQAFIEASAGGPTPLSPEGLANAVLDALLADHNDAGTVGEALNSIGASANPWSADLASNATAGTFGKRVQELLKKTEFLGLK